ncbi:MAG TPA: A/G-specific adenine glycosylase [Terracidiphilus sp.]|jgi:A/G-specific adenine glycosylase
MAKTDKTNQELTQLRAALLTWYGANRRDLPWRRSRDPYAIWVSEIMLQQTRVAVVVDRFGEFMARFPTVAALAAAAEQDVLAVWSGLGYYRRARMLHKAAQFVTEHCAGALPGTAAALRLLPGIGGYTSAAIASIAYGEPVAVVDGNVERVLCRLAGWDAGKNSTELRGRIEGLAAELVDKERAGDFNQAMMELGAVVCMPRNPQCLVCPLVGACKTRGEHKTAPRARMVTREAAYALCLRETNTGEVLLEQRPASMTVMPGLWELPVLRDVKRAAAEAHMTVRHAIMQVNYRVHVCRVGEDEIARATQTGGERRWVALKDTSTIALTGLARKVLRRMHEVQRGGRDSTVAPGTIEADTGL